MEKFKLIEPRERSTAERLRFVLLDAKVDEHDAKTIVTAMLAGDHCSSDEEANEFFLHLFAKDIQNFGRESAFVQMVDKLLSETIRLKDPRQTADNLARCASESNWDMNNGLVAAAPNLAWPHRVAKFLYDCDLISLDSLIDHEKAKLLATRDPVRRFDFTTLDKEAQKRDITSLQFWIMAIGVSALHETISRVETVDNGEACELAGAVDYVIAWWLQEKYRHWERHSKGGSELAFALFPLCLNLRERSDALPCMTRLRDLWLKFAWVVSEADPSVIQGELAEHTLKAAQDDLGRLRKVLRGLGQCEADGRVFQENWSRLRPRLFLVYNLGGFWKGTRALLLAFRALGTPSLAPDLRYWWQADREPVPEPYNLLPMAFYAMFHNRAAEEEEHDPDLETYRIEFAKFCFDRLRTAGAKKDPKEPDPYWRACYLRAVGELGVNPGGKGHHLVHWLIENDPDDDVKEAATNVYADLRHSTPLPKGMSPRRAVLHAFWWLSQAHMLALDAKIDADGAQRTREEEVRRTTEVGDQERNRK